LTALLHHVTPELLRQSYYELKRQAAPGVDGVTWQEYEEGMEGRITDLHRRVHQGTYRARPSRRTYILKEDGRKRPLGISALEDKIVQQAVRTVLEVIYEEEFLGFSYGFRPGRSQHNALDALWVGIVDRPINWVLDADIRGYFDAIDHGWLVRMIEHRIGDRRILRLITLWLKAGVFEQGQWSPSEEGTPQGAVISPLLANIYLHYVLDLWSRAHRNQPGKGAMIIVRYADDFVVGFQHLKDAQRYWQELSERLGQFGLELSAEKTRLIEFGRHAARDRQRSGQKRPDTFVFLGFRHICGKNRKGGFTILRKTVGKRLRKSLKKFREQLRRRRHDPLPEQGKWIRAVVQGYFNYNAVPGNSNVLNSFRTAVNRAWRRSLKRRSQKNQLTWERFNRYVRRWIPSVRILHPPPFMRFSVTPR
jgi:group II intron reverse transcriptase/maturase